MLKKILVGKLAYRLFGDKAKQIITNPKNTKALIMDANEKAARNKNTLQSVWEQLQLLLQMLNSYRKGEYKGVSKSTILIITVGLVYFLSPVDLIPDIVVGAGLIDDVALIGYIAKKINQDILKYKQWVNHSNQPTQSLIREDE